MRVIVLKRDDKITRTMQFENPEDYDKFRHDLMKVEDALRIWPSRPLELQLDFMEVSITTLTSDEKKTDLVPAEVPAQASV